MLVSVSQLQDYMSGIGLDDDQTRAMEDVLKGLQRQLERYCQRPMERTERTETITPDDLGRLWPKATPVSAVATPGYAIGGGDRANQLVSDSGFGFGPASMFGLPTAAVTVTYTGGLSGEDEDDVRLAIMRVAARIAENRHDDVLDPSDLTARKPKAADPREPEFTDKELTQFDRLRRRTVA